MRNIIQEIQENLFEIEKTENVKVLYCVESGSRAWGFPSPDSDYDVRFIYMHDIGYYLNLEKQKDVIEWKLDDVLDINGWDIQKMLRLLHNSNPTIFEWNASPIVYKTSEEWKLVSRIIPDFFSPKSGLYHYLSMAKSNYKAYLIRDKVRIKKYFYALRPLLACKWILERKSPPPMPFSELIDHELDENIKPYVLKLLKIKQSTSELGEGDRIEILNTYIETQLDELTDAAQNLNIKHDKSWKLLDDVFRNTLGYKTYLNLP